MLLAERLVERFGGEKVVLKEEVEKWEETFMALSLEELELVRKVLERVIADKKREAVRVREYEFKFEASNDPRKGVPFVAKLVVEGGKLVRKFYNLAKTYGKKEVSVFGTVRVADGDVIEIRWGGSWRNDYRYWYYIKDRKAYLVADESNATEKTRVLKFLLGQISEEELLKHAKVTNAIELREV